MVDCPADARLFHDHRELRARRGKGGEFFRVLATGPPERGEAPRVSTGDDAPISCWMRATTGAGVPFGAYMPYQT
jgi:hypothetical protein